MSLGGLSLDTKAKRVTFHGTEVVLTRKEYGILEYLMTKYNMDIQEMLNILNKKSGVLGVSGVSSDFRDLDAAASQGNHRAALALETFRYNVKKLVGAYAAAMGGVDAIVFTAGAANASGENTT